MKMDIESIEWDRSNREEGQDWLAWLRVYERSLKQWSITIEINMFIYENDCINVKGQV